MNEPTNVVRFPRVAAASPRMQPRVTSRASRPKTASDIWDAVQEDRLRLHYQPQLDIRTGRIIAAQALVRLIDEDGELVYPAWFIDRVRSGDLVVPVGRAVLRQACIDLKRCRDRGIDLPRTAISLPAQQLKADSGLLDVIDNLLSDYGLDYDNLDFELGQRHRLNPGDEVVCAIRRLADLGARITLDRFGTGFSSIHYLTQLPVSAIKLDERLVQTLPDDARRLSVVRSLVAFASRMNIEVVAEGVENAAHHMALVDAGCEFAQGPGCAAPMPIMDLCREIAHSQVSRKDATPLV